ncbi:hypothetical protein BC830DRAFT_1068353, partial [Chytriomyces sp. MP71]
VTEGNANYMFMHHVLTGIRVSVSRCNAKPVRDLAPEDFEAVYKIALTCKTGNELAPSSRYDFKICIFYLTMLTRIDPTNYLLSLTGKYVLSELGRPGKSGSFFYFNQDFRFIIKTIHFSGHKFIRCVLNNDYDHVISNPNTLLFRIFGLHTVKLPGNKKIHFVVMRNVLPSNKDIHENYDLESATVGRMKSEAKAEGLSWWIKGIEQYPVSKKDQHYGLFSALGIQDLVKGVSPNCRLC